MKVSLSELADWLAVKFHSLDNLSDVADQRHAEWLHAAEMELRKHIAAVREKEIEAVDRFLDEADDLLRENKKP